MSQDLQLMVADIGGTNSRFAIFEICADQLLCKNSVWLATAEFSSFSNLLGAAASGLNVDNFAVVDAAVIAVAGPVQQGKFCKAPNISWDIEIDRIEKGLLPQQVILINDFVAQAYATVANNGVVAKEVYPGVCNEQFPRVIIGVGTGLGKAALVPNGICGSSSGLQHVASEGGHAGFCIESVDEMPFLEFVLSGLDKPYVEWEDVLSGRGLELIHRFCCSEKRSEKLSAMEISQRLKPGSATLELFAKFLGRMCRDFTLEFMARGGIYLTGGVLAKNPLVLRSNSFRQALLNLADDTVSIANIPVYLVDQEDSGLWGAANYACLQLNRST